MQRSGRKVSFYQRWKHYKKGFGNAKKDGDHFIG